MLADAAAETEDGEALIAAAKKAEEDVAAEDAALEKALCAVCVEVEANDVENIHEEESRHVPGHLWVKGGLPMCRGRSSGIGVSRI